MAAENIRGDTPKQSPPVVENEQFSDIILILDKMELLLQAVTKLDKNGRYESVAAKEENRNSFLKLDRYANMFESFVKNLWSQLKDPTRFGILSVKEQALDDPKVRQAIEDLAAGKKTDAVAEFLAKDDITPKGKGQSINNQNDKEMAKQEQTTQAQTPQDGQPKYRFNESMIDWEQLKHFGLSREYLQERGLLDSMLKGYKTNQVVPITMNFGSAVLRTDARLSFQQSTQGPVVLGIHGIRQQPDLERPFFGHIFSEEDKKNLRETGNMGRVVDLVDKETGEIIPSIVSIDRKTNELTDLAANKIRVQSKIGETEITPQEQTMLRAGLSVKDKHIVFSDGREFITTLQANVEKRGPEFVPGTTRSVKKEQAQENKEEQKTAQGEKQEDGKTRRNTWVNEDGSIRSISKWSDVKFTEQQKADYVAGKAIRLENVTDKQGFHALMYIKFSPDRGRPLRYETNPDMAQQVAPANESRTQVAVNNEGKTNEATKNLKDPLQKGQTTPKDDVQRQQQEKPQKKSKGMRV